MGVSGNSGSAAANAVFRPSLVVNLQILFDQGLQENFAPKSAANLAQQGGDTAPAATPSPAITTESGAESFSKIMNIVPTIASIELPGYRQAATFSLDLLHRDLPIDPRVIRALRAEIHLGAVSHEDFEFGMIGRAGEGGRRSSILVPTAANLVMIGMADNVSSEFGERGSILHFEGRDLRGILLDSNIASGILEKIDLKQPLNLVVQDLVDKFHPSGKGIQVATQASEWPNGVVPSPHVVGDQTRPQFDADPAQASRAQQGAPDGKTTAMTMGNPNTISYWDMITQWCLLVGGVPYFVGPQLRIRPARSLYDQRMLDSKPFDPAFPYPFGGNQPHKREIGHPLVAKPEIPFGYRRLVYGKDISNLKFERKLGGMVVPAIRVVSYDSDNTTKGAANRLIEAVYPPEGEDARRASSVGSSGKGAKCEEIYFPVYGVKNRDKLLNIAKSLHAEIGRQELGGSVTTKNLSSFGGNNQDPDLLHLRPGDPVEFRTVDSGMQTYPPFTAELLDHTSKSEAAEIEAVAKRLGDKALATAIVQSARGNLQQLTRTFRTSNVKFDWSADAGINIAFDFQNFVEIRYTDPAETTGTAESIEILPAEPPPPTLDV